MCANSFFDQYFMYAAPTLEMTLNLILDILPFDASLSDVLCKLILIVFILFV